MREEAGNGNGSEASRGTAAPRRRHKHVKSGDELKMRGPKKENAKNEREEGRETSKECWEGFHRVA